MNRNVNDLNDGISALHLRQQSQPSNGRSEGRPASQASGASLSNEFVEQLKRTWTGLHERKAPAESTSAQSTGMEPTLPSLPCPSEDFP